MALDESREWRLKEPGKVSQHPESDNARAATDRAAWGRPAQVGVDAPAERDAKDAAEVLPADLRRPAALDAEGWGRAARQPIVEGARVDREALEGAMLDHDNAEPAGVDTPESKRDISEGDLAIRADDEATNGYESPDGLQELPITDLQEVGGRHANGVYRVEMLDGSEAYLKPQNEECENLRPDAIPEGTEWTREVAASDLDDLLGLQVVPETVERTEQDLEMEHASLQAAVPHDGLPRDRYTERDQQAMAAFDYISGNLDRNPDNHRTTTDGCVAATDNGLCFPENDTYAIRSGFVADWFDRPFTTDVLEDLSHVSDNDITQALTHREIGREGIQGVLDRLHEMQENGRITGSAWHGEIEYFDNKYRVRSVRERR